MSETVYGLSERDVRRLRDLLNRSERTFRNSPPERQRWPAPGWAGLIPAYTKAGGFAAGSRTAPTSATVTLQKPGVGNAMADDVDVLMWNYSTRAITVAGKLIYLTPWNGKLIFAVGDC